MDISSLHLISDLLQKDIMDPNAIIMTLAGTIQLGVLWWMKQTWDNQKAFAVETEEKQRVIDKNLNAVFNHLNDFKVEVAKEYASKEDITEIKQLLKDLALDLKAKVDK